MRVRIPSSVALVQRFGDAGNKIHQLFRVHLSSGFLAEFPPILVLSHDAPHSERVSIAARLVLNASRGPEREGLIPEELRR